MEIIYCRDKLKLNEKSYPSLGQVSDKISQARRNNWQVIIFDYNFLLKRPKLDLTCFKDRVCLLCFETKQQVDLKKVKKLGFFDYLCQQSSPVEIAFKINRAKEVAGLKVKNCRLSQNVACKQVPEKTILIDALTGCHNWRYFLAEAKRQLVRSKRYAERVSFIGIDIDHFRQINEIYGMKTADKVIKEVVRLLSRNLRQEDILSRWREDEFFIIAPYLDKKNVALAAHRLREAIAKHKFHYKKVNLGIKVSVGALSFPEDSIFNSKDVAAGLDRAIGQAKRKGGNTVVIASLTQAKPVIKKKEKSTIKEMRQKVEKLNILLNKDILDVIYGFARAIEAKDAYTGSHLESTAAVAKKIAKELNLPANEVEDIERAAVLHDLGKVGIDGRILSKKGDLTLSEKEKIKNHPSIASEIIKDIYGLRGAVPGVLYHHECFNGTGYPLGLKGDEIPLSARIVAVADVYHALISDRPYRKAYSKKTALSIIKRESGSHFDPKIVKIFVKVI